MENKKILVVSTSFPMKPGDPLSPFIWEYCLSLSKHNWKVVALVPHHRGLPDEEDWQGIHIRRFRYLPERFEDLGYTGGILPNIKSKPWRILKVPFYVYGMYREAVRVVEEREIDVVNFHWLFPASFWLGQFTRSAAVPAVLTGHGTDIHLATRWIFKFFANRAFRKASALTVNSEYMKTILGGNELPSKVEVIPMGVDGSKFSPGDQKPSDSKTVLFVGRLIRQKGIDLLAAAFVEVVKAIPQARLEIIGYGPEKENIQDIIAFNRLEESVRISEMIPHERLPDFYRRARVLLLPSLVPEGLGMTPAEAGLCGVPTITFGLGGTSEIVVDKQTGLIIEPTKESLVKALIAILTDDAKADSLGENARMYLAGKIEWEIVGGRFDKLLRDVANKDHRSNMAVGAPIVSAIIIVLVTFGYLVKFAIDRFERILSLFR